MIAKIEKPEAVSHIDAILDVADGIMVARGDLGVEMSPEQVPVVQKQLIAAARKKSRIVITATQMLESMTRNRGRRAPRRATSRTRSSTGPTWSCSRPRPRPGAIRSRRCARWPRSPASSELSEGYGRAMEQFHLPDGQGVVHAAVRASCVASEEVNARAIIPFTASGWTAFLVAAMRTSTPVIACTYNASTYHRLALAFGVTPVLISQARDIDDLYVIGMQKLLTAGMHRPGRRRRRPHGVGRSRERRQHDQDPPGRHRRPERRSRDPAAPPVPHQGDARRPGAIQRGIGPINP